jgi:tRNA threonylcarbamoyladenosine biosynthesis protein TsaE
MDSPEFSKAQGSSLTIHSDGVDATRRLGRDIGRAITSPIVISLTGTLGCGKTAFVQGLAEGLDVGQAYTVNSPTFTLINEYPGRLPLYHVDLYRLDDVVELEDIGLDEILAAEGVVAVEWAEKLPAADTDRGLTIRFEVREGNLRKIVLSAGGQPGSSLLKAIRH